MPKLHWSPTCCRPSVCIRDGWRERGRRAIGDYRRLLSEQDHMHRGRGGAWGSLSAVVEAEPLPSYISRGEGLRIPPQHSLSLLLICCCSNHAARMTSLRERECSEWHADELFLQYAGILILIIIFYKLTCSV